MVWYLGSDTAVLTFTFHFLSYALFLLFLHHFFFSCWAFSRLHFGGKKVFKKAFRILGLGERKGRWAVEQDFHENFQVNVTWFFAFFSGVLDWIVLILVCFERSLHSAQVRGQSCPWLLKLMMSQGVERMWIHTGGYRCLRGEWVKYKLFFSLTTGRIFVAIIFFVFVQPK